MDDLIRNSQTTQLPNIHDLFTSFATQSHNAILFLNQLKTITPAIIRINCLRTPLMSSSSEIIIIDQPRSLFQWYRISFLVSIQLDSLTVKRLHFEDLEICAGICTIFMQLLIVYFLVIIFSCPQRLCYILLWSYYSV